MNRRRPALSSRPLPTILFAGIVSGALAYTIQIFAQAHTPPAEAALILALEGVFAALAGALLLSERLTAIGASWLRADSGRRVGGRDRAVVGRALTLLAAAKASARAEAT